MELFAIDLPERPTHLKEDTTGDYWDYAYVLDEEKAAATLPDQRRPDDFLIDLDPSKPLPKPSRPYYMNQKERAECRKIPDEMLKDGIVE